MHKRAYPFEESFSPQNKVHVGQKQVDKGISSEERMKEVYGKQVMLCVVLKQMNLNFGKSVFIIP